MESYSKVGMQELDQRLSKIVEAARKKPVSVYRYGAPWVWIVSQEDWQGALKEVSSYIPPGHSLALLKPQIESLLGEEAKVLSALAREHGMQLAPEPLIHALLLQLLYAIPSEQQLYEQLNYNLLYRWFVGLEMKQKIWSFRRRYNRPAEQRGGGKDNRQDYRGSDFRGSHADAGVLPELRLVAYMASAPWRSATAEYLARK
ncbi:hypothetical protein VNPA120719_08800 [Pseudomonas aeruginosa]|nr:hypothetical protein VNPA110516_36560 [Pseudomonas aeruginosa]GLE74826.1 hypothetical protein VNPA120641_16920 [Pseudomonas aeruginosa]GLE87492.1 hypothetical protein VNPA120719_08800 [Pseudomonas aeruginosa]